MSVRVVTDEAERIDCLVGRPRAGGVICSMLAAALFVFGVGVVGTVSAGATGALFAVAVGSMLRPPMRRRARRTPAPRAPRPPEGVQVEAA